MLKNTYNDRMMAARDGLLASRRTMAQLESTILHHRAKRAASQSVAQRAKIDVVINRYLDDYTVAISVADHQRAVIDVLLDQANAANMAGVAFRGSEILESLTEV